MTTPETYRCWAEIDLVALRHNARVARGRVGSQVALMAVIKANGYGHGLTEAAKALREDAAMFGVANLREALEARAVVPHPIVILGPALPAERAAIIEHQFIPSVSSFEEAQEFSRAAASSSVAVDCVLDTGMGRMGIAERGAIPAMIRIAALPNLTIHSVSTHLPVADEDSAYTRTQLERFGELIAQIRREVPGSYLTHVLLSAGVLEFSKSAHDIVRPGLMLYGISANPDFQKLLHPVMSLKTRVALIREVSAGSSISYGRTFIAPGPMRVATLSAGYADGFPKAISNRDAAVLIHGRPCPVLGRVTMDLTMVDVTDVPDIALGDEVVIFGRQEEAQILLTEVAARASTIPWAVLTGIGTRVPRVYG